MGKRIGIILVTVLLGLSMTACSKAEKTRYEASFLDVFDTVTKIVGFADSKEEFTEYARMIHDKMKEYHELYDIYNNYEGINNIKTINDNAGIAPVKVDQRIIDLLKFSKEAYQFSNGEMNIAFGAVTSVWHDYRTEGMEDPDRAELPPMELLEERNEHTNIDDLIIDENASTVYLKDPQMRLDVGSVAKGYTTQKICEYAREIGFTNGTISAGGNVETIGSKLDGKAGDDTWSIGIQNPDLESENSNLYILGINDYALVTSGVYERYYTVNGKNYHHLIDKDTLMPTEYFLSVSILCRDSGMADALSTAVFNVPYEEGLALVESYDDTEALWVFPDGSMKYSSGFEKFIKK